MIAMPYIVVNLVLQTIALILFCTTSAALLSKYQVTNLYLPAQLRTHRALAFVAQGLVVLGLSIIVLRVVGRGRPVFLSAQSVFEVFFYLGLASSVVLTYQFLDRRCAPKTSKVQRRLSKVPRRLWIALCAVLFPAAAALAVAAAVFQLFLIR